MAGASATPNEVLSACRSPLARQARSLPKAVVSISSQAYSQPSNHLRQPPSAINEMHVGIANVKSLGGGKVKRVHRFRL
jgi:hypothetical protein